MPSPFLTGALRFLHSRTVATFGGAEKLWWPAAEGAAGYTVPVDCASAPLQGQSRDLTGLLTMASDSQVFHCALADFPFEPRPDMIFLFGPPLANSDPPAADSAACRKFMVKSTQVFGEHITVTAELHGGA